MNLSKSNYFLPFVFFLSLLITISACKKDKVSDDEVPPVENDGQLSDADSLKYLMYGIMQVSLADGGRDQSMSLPMYYWYDQVPKLDPLDRAYDSAGVLLNKIKTYAVNPVTGKPFDKYSFLDHGEVSDEIQQGVAGDLGMQVTFARTASDIVLVVIYVDKNGPAGLAGIKRGDLISAVNGTKVVYDGADGAVVNKVVKAVYYDNEATFDVVRADETTFKAKLNKAVYTINPVLFDTIFNVSNSKTGYFVFNTFSNVSYDNAPTLTKQKIDEVFSRFEGAGIKNLIVDLRYNGGGATNTAEYLDGRIAPSSATGKVMYNLEFNDKLTAVAPQIGLEKQVKFTHTGNLNLDNVFFITSRSTASASELVINSLRPYLNVKVVGDTTYGKPVGFYGMGISIFKKGKEKHLADLYAINFELKNANGEGGYYEGMVPDAMATDFVNVPWGNAADDNLKTIFSFIKNGSFARHMPLERMAGERNLKMPIQPVLKSVRFDGMVDYERGEKLMEFLRKNAK